MPDDELILQTLDDALVRGWTYSAAEHDRAIRYKMAVIARAKERVRLLNMLKGDPEAGKALLRNTMARTKSPPAYIEE